MEQDDEHWMLSAIELAQHAAEQDEVPIGAVIINHKNQLIGEGWNQPIASHDSCAHAEIIALRQAGIHLHNYRLLGTTLYSTLEPCIMCAGAMIHARIKRLVFATPDLKAGGVISVCQVLDLPQLNHRVQYEYGLCAELSSQLLKNFFKQKRALNQVA